MSSHAEPPAPVTSWMRSWGLLALMTLLNVLNFVDRQLIPSLAPMLMADLQLTRAQIGLLVGFAFVVFYTVMGMVLGAAADRVSRPRLIAAGLGLWSLMTAVSGMARGFVGLAVPRMLVGVGEATLTPAALSMMADVLPRQRLALATGIYYAGIPIGTALSLLIAGWMAPRYGWRSCFYLLGVVGLVLTGLLWLMRDPREARDSRTAAERATASRGFGDTIAALGRALVALPSFGLAILGGSMLCYGSAAALLAITWLVQERGVPYERAAYQAGLIAVASGFFGNLLGGWFADACQRRWVAGRLWALVILTVITSPVAVAFYLLPVGTPLFYVCWVMAISAATAYFGPLFAVIQEVAPVGIRSTAVAFGLLGLNLLGVGPGPWITGLIGDASSLTRGLLVSQAVVFASIVPFTLAARRYPRDVARAATM